MTKAVDYIIVGQGLAGSILSQQLKKQGFSFVVIDKGIEKSSSVVAAGIMNPLVLKRLTKTWRADEFVTYNKQFYKEVNTIFQQELWKPIIIEKLISSSDEKSFWYHRFKTAQLNEYIEPKLSACSHNLLGKKNYSSGIVKQASWLNVELYLKKYRNYLNENRLLLNEVFDFDCLENFEKVRYKNITAKGIIFCEGAEAINNPYFNYLRFKLTKGQTVDINCELQTNNSILQKKVFIHPFAKNHFKVGASFSWEWENESVEKLVSKQLLMDLEDLGVSNYKVIYEKAGIRPSVEDRRPLVGEHPIHNNVFIFNGMGARACMMVPLLAKELATFLKEKTPLHKEVLLSRYNRFLPQL